MKHLFIINPVAGKGKGLGLIKVIEEIFKESKDEYIIEITKYVGHATEIVKSYVKEDRYRIYSVGGDGTLNEVLNGMVGSSSSLAVIPSGTGNDFIRSICDNYKDEDLLKNTIYGEEKEVDLGTVNERYFINISSIGIDAEVVYNARAFKKLPFVKGGLAYILSIFYTVIKFKNNKMSIHIDGKDYSNDILLIAVANGSYYGGGMHVAPKASPFDNLFDICLIRPISRINILRLFPKLIKGVHENIKEVSFYKCKSINIKSENEMSINIDGEVFRIKEAKFDIIPKGVTVVIPKK